MARPIPSCGPNFYHGTREDTDDNNATQEGEDLVFLADGGSSRPYSTSGSVIVSNSVGSSTVQPLVGFYESTPVFSEAFETFLPLADPIFTQNGLYGNPTRSSNSIIFPMIPDATYPTVLEAGNIFSTELDNDGYFSMEFDNFLPMLRPNNQDMPFAGMQTDLTRFRNLDNLGVLEQRVLAEPYSTFLWSNTGPWIESFDNERGDAMITDGTINPAPHQQRTTEHNNSSPAVMMSQEYSTISSDASVASFDRRPFFQDRPQWISGMRDTANEPSVPPLDARSTEMTFPSLSFVSVGRDDIPKDAILGKLTPVLGERAHEPHQVKAKPGAPTLFNFLNFDSNSITKRPRQRPGRRSQLDIQAREDAAFMREKHACAPCFVSNLKCTKHDICIRCRKLPRSPFLGEICTRGHLEDYVDVFLPPFLVDHLRRAATKQFNENLHFLDEECVVRLSTGRTHPPITLLVSKFVPPDQEFLMVSDLTSETNDHTRAFATIQSLPYAMRNYSVEQIKQKCRDHFEAISKPGNITGDSSTLQCKILLAISRYLETIPVSRSSNLLRNAIMMNRIQYVMGRQIVVYEASALDAAKSLEHQSEFHPQASLSARALTRQLKGIIQLLLEDLARKVLEELDWQLRQKKTEYGAVCLCTFLALCMSTEDLQVSLDAFALFMSTRKSSTEDGDPSQRGTEACGNLEEEALNHSWILLNGILKRMLKKHNPFKNGGDIECIPDENEAKRNLMNDLRELMVSHNDEISTQSVDNYTGGRSQLVVDHKIFRRRNSGRLISKVLKELPRL